ncbi:MAG TPA: hypothetical protein PK430_03515 [Muribaculum sp.]|uniref:SRPBCC family protein n=1 Tax=Heminiphilus faecis TaxID=2601703 RepID=A0ABV4CX51_9BACT|nr:hypothetical protein [Heminiphilus faecis]RLT77313.1 hypothetical protein D7V95_03985 [bacterium J10(2018)]HRF68268.1 hypothetical protein [Muribaculum sp.]
MTTYSSKPATLDMPVETVYKHISDIAAYQEKINGLPDEIKQKIGNVTFADDKITIKGAPMGDIELVVSERVENKRMALNAMNSPVPIIMSINLDEQGTGKTQVVTSIDVEMPAILKPMVGPKLQEAAEKFGDMIKNLAFVK